MNDNDKNSPQAKQPPGPDATFEELVEWYQSDEFSDALTNAFWEVKKQAIAERDAVLAAQSQQQQQQ